MLTSQAHISLAVGFHELPKKPRSHQPGGYYSIRGLILRIAKILKNPQEILICLEPFLRSEARKTVVRALHKAKNPYSIPNKAFTIKGSRASSALAHLGWLAKQMSPAKTQRCLAD